MIERWRGLKSLVQDGVEHGSRVVERLQKEAAKKPFEILERVPLLEVPVKGIHEIHDTGVTGVHAMIRLVNRVAGDTIDAVLVATQKPTDGAPAETRGERVDAAAAPDERPVSSVEKVP